MLKCEGLRKASGLPLGFLRIVKLRNENVGVIWLEVSWIYGNKENSMKYSGKRRRHAQDSTVEKACGQGRGIHLSQRRKNREYLPPEIGRGIDFFLRHFQHQKRVCHWVDCSFRMNFAWVFYMAWRSSIQRWKKEGRSPSWSKTQNEGLGTQKRGLWAVLLASEMPLGKCPLLWYSWSHIVY